MLSLPRRKLWIGAAATAALASMRRGEAAFAQQQPAIIRGFSRIAEFSAVEIDVFGVAGQSNSVGHAEITDAEANSPIPATGTALSYFNSAIVPCVDPVGDATYGSAWPKFCDTYYKLTGRIVCVVPTGVGGSGQWVGQATVTSPINVNGTWDPLDPSSHVPGSIAKMQAALVALAAAGYNPIFRGVLWDQGEGDASYHNTGQETAADYAAAFNRMRPVYLDAPNLGGTFFCFQIGTNSGDVLLNQPPYIAIRDAQTVCIENDPRARMVFDKAKFFPRGQSPILVQVPNDVHYTQAGYNRMGHEGACNVVDWLFHTGAIR